MNIAVIGCGYVGMSMATLLSVKHHVTAIDVLEERVEKINNRIPPIQDEYIEMYFKNQELDLKATTDIKEGVADADIVIVAVPTSYDESKNKFDTSVVTSVCSIALQHMKDGAFIVIKSTIPIGYTEQLSMSLKTDKIMFSPEFLREGKALEDNLYPSRIVVGTDRTEQQLKWAASFATMLKECSLMEDPKIFLIGRNEAEALKLFANTYLAMRVAYFNELDMYAEENGLNAQDIINGICSDPRIGDFYNNPSFGYGGYCLPKDSKQLYRSYENIPQKIMEAIIASNDQRKTYITRRIYNKLKENGGKTIGIYRLAMKADSDNFRSAAIIDIMQHLSLYKDVEVVIYEPTYDGVIYMGRNVLKSLDEFKEKADLIVANRITDEIRDVSDKIYTRDVFGNN